MRFSGTFKGLGVGQGTAAASSVTYTSIRGASPLRLRLPRQPASSAEGNGGREKGGAAVTPYLPPLPVMREGLSAGVP